MNKEKSKEAIYDERVNATLKGLLEGKSRDELARKFKLNSWKSLDIYMRRKGFAWNREKQTYEPSTKKVDKILDEVVSSTPIKAQQIIRKFEQYGQNADPRAIAKEMGFDDHREMAEFMKRKGLIWDSDKGNYVEILHSSRNPISESLQEAVLEKVVEIPFSKGNNGDLDGLLKYLPLLQLLEENKDRLMDLLMPNSDGHIPRYAVPGVPKTKSIYMSDLLARLVAEFCETKNLSQREVAEAAMIEYLKRYGYQLEVEKLLAKK